jgi:hypothetical protein
MEIGVDAIVVDSGSTDPYQLGLGATLVSEAAYLRDLRRCCRPSAATASP